MANVIEYLLKLNDQMSGKLGKVNAGLSDMQGKIAGGLRNLGGPFDSLASKIDGIPIGLAAVGAAIAGVAAAGAGMFKLAEGVANTAIQFDILSQKTGASVEFLSTLTAAANDAEISTETFNTALTKFSDNLIAVAGPSANVQHELMALADVFANMPDGPQKTALAIDAFGRAGAAMIPLLNQGSEGLKQLQQDMADTGRVITQETVVAAMQFDDAMDKLGGSIEGLTVTIGGSLIPAVTGIVDGINGAMTSVNLFGVALRELSNEGEVSTLTLERLRLAAIDAATGASYFNPAGEAMRAELEKLREATIKGIDALNKVPSAGRVAADGVLAAGSAFLRAGDMALGGANKFYLSMNIIGQAAQAPVQYQRTLQTNANRMNSLLKDQARDAENSIKAYGARYTQQAVEMGRAIGASSANFELFSKAVGGAGAAVKELTADQQALIDRTNALKGALSQSIKPMDAGEQLQTAYAIATGEVSVAQFEQEQAVKALLTAMEQQKLTNDQVLTTVLGMREGVLSSNDAFEAAGEAGAAARDEYNKVVSSADIATKRIADLSLELKNVPKDSKVKVSAVISGLRDVQEMRSEVESIRDRNVTVTVTTRYTTSGTPPPGDPGAPGGGTGGGTGGTGNGEGGGRTSFVVNTPVTVKETNPRNAAAYVARMQRHTARQAALRAQAGFMG